MSLGDCCIHELRVAGKASRVGRLAWSVLKMWDGNMLFDAVL